MPRGRVQLRFLTTGEVFPVQQKIEQVNDQHPVIISVCVQTVSGDDDLGEGIIDAPERILLGIGLAGPF